MQGSWSTKLRWDTGYSADSVEWCPVQPYRNTLVSGTYQLDSTQDQGDEKSKQTRLGRVYLFTINAITTELDPVQTIDTSGILDQKWSYQPINGHPVLAVVTSVGSLQLYRLVSKGEKPLLELWIEGTVGEEVLALSLDWSTNKLASEEPMLVISDSAGSVSVMKIVEDGLVTVGVWKAHGFEAWIAAFNYWNTNTFYTGGDDCLFKTYDIRVAESCVTSNRSHEAGVTAIRCHADVEHQLLTGSYDEKVRLWDTRNLKRCITEADVKGGVWRLKWHPSKYSYILAACMYGGFRILNLEGDNIKITCEYLEHESIAYGADWQFDSNLVATCSFYDCKLHVGEVTL